MRDIKPSTPASIPATILRRAMPATPSNIFGPSLPISPIGIIATAIAPSNILKAVAFTMPFWTFMYSIILSTTASIPMTIDNKPIAATPSNIFGPCFPM